MDTESGEVPVHKPPSGGEAPKAPSRGFSCMAITRLTLRCVEFVLSLICFSLIAASSTYLFAAGAFLLSMGVLTCAYAIAAITLLLVAVLVPSTELTFKLPRPLLITDFVMLVLLFSASSTAAAGLLYLKSTYTSSYSYYYSWSSYTYAVETIYEYGAGAAAMGFLASFCLMADFWLTLVPVFVEI